MAPSLLLDTHALLWWLVEPGAAIVSAFLFMLRGQI